MVQTWVTQSNRHVRPSTDLLHFYGAPAGSWSMAVLCRVCMCCVRCQHRMHLESWSWRIWTHVVPPSPHIITHTPYIHAHVYYTLVFVMCVPTELCAKKKQTGFAIRPCSPPTLGKSLVYFTKKKTGFATRPCSLLTLGKSRAAFLFRDARACKLLGATLRKPGVYAYRTTRSCVWRACLKGVDLTTRTKTWLVHVCGMAGLTMWWVKSKGQRDDMCVQSACERVARVIFFFIDFFFCKVHVYLFLGSASWILKVSLSFS